MHFGILGELRVERDGNPVVIGRRRERLLLARLLVDANTTVSVDRLLEDCWAGDPPASAVGSLQAHVSRLRRALEPDRDVRGRASVLVTRDPGYALLVDPSAVDADRFVALADEGRRHATDGEAAAAVTAWDQALSLWRGEVLADLRDEPFVAPLASGLRERRAAVREDRAAALLQLGDNSAAIADMEALVVEEDHRERAWEVLVTALHAAGRTPEALARLRDLRDDLAEELGLDLGRGLQELETALLRGEPVGGTRSTPTVRARPTAAAGAAHVAARTSPPVASALPPLVGRGAERTRLRSLVDAVRQGTTAWAVVTGEAGIGKTRLVGDLRATAQEAGVHVVAGHCLEGHLTPAFWPWAQALGQLEPLVEGAGAVLDQPDAVAGDPSARLLAQFRHVAQVLTDAATRQPVLVVVEDVHWADPESLQLTRFLSVELTQTGIGIVLTSRPEEGGDELRDVLADLTRRPGFVRVELSGLDEDGTAELVTSITGSETDRRTAAALAERTGGNPLFVGELVRLGAGALLPGRLPDTVRDVLGRRLARVDDATRDLLALAAMHGESFRLGLLLATCGLDEGAVLDHLDAAMAAGLVAPDEDPSRLRFVHALVREAALQGLPDLRRRRLHLRIGTAVRDLAPSGTSWEAEAAHHLLAAAPLGDPRAALDAARAAALVATARAAYREAVHWWRGALRVLEWDRELGEDQELRLELLVALGVALADGGDQPGAVEQLATAMEVAVALGDVGAMTDVAVALERSSGIWFWAEYEDRPVALLDRLEHVAAAVGDDVGARVRVLAVSAIGEGYGDLDRGRRIAAEAVALARDSGDHHLLATALIAEQHAWWSHEHREQQSDRAREMLDLARTHDLPEVELHGLTHRMMLELLDGTLDAAEDTFLRADALGERLGLDLYRAQLRWTGAIFPRARGDLGRAADLLAAARDQHVQLRVYGVEEIVSWTSMALALDMGSFEGFDDDLWAVTARAFPEAVVARRIEQGDVAGAATQLRAICAGPPQPERYDRMGRITMRARLTADLGLAELAPALLAEVEPYGSCLGAIGMCSTVGPVGTEVGRLLSLLGHHDRAVTVLTATHERAVAAGWPLWAERAGAHLDTARALRGATTVAATHPGR